MSKSAGESIGPTSGKGADNNHRQSAPETGAMGEGDVGVPFQMVVERGKIREFAAATGSHSHEYFAEQTPVSPVTFLASSLFWRGPDSMPRAQLRLDPRRTLHGSQEFIFHGAPPSAGTVLDCQTHTSAEYQKTGSRGDRMLFVELTTEYRSSAGKLVAESISTLIETSPPTNGGQTPA